MPESEIKRFGLVARAEILNPESKVNLYPIEYSRIINISVMCVNAGLSKFIK